MPELSATIVNFGGNVRFTPTERFAPTSEAEVLQLLARFRGRKIRAIGRLHSWSDAPVSEDVVLDLRHLNEVRIEQKDGEVWATVGAGCQIKRVLVELERQANVTLPTLGLISEQAIVGAMSTGTHGSGKQSLSHYMAEARIAMYDARTGEPVIRTINSGDELRAARCSLGCLGIIVSVRFLCRPQYRIEEHLRSYPTLSEVLDAEIEYPLQQFYMIPWAWQWMAQHRRETEAPRSWLAGLYRLDWLLLIDLGLHLLVQLLVQWLRSPRLVRFFFRYLAPLVVLQNWKVVDKAQDQLIMEHELFRHIEVELFVTCSRLAAALDFVKEMLQVFAGDVTALSDATRQRLSELGLLDALLAAAGNYTHHYPLCIRRVLPDDTLISMASGDDESYYAISFISYARVNEREGFFQFAHWMAESMAAQFSARLHWGKVCPLNAAQLARLYPQLAKFREVCEANDPNGVFRNAWADAALFAEQEVVHT